MEWLLGLAILSALLCGLVCIGGMALAAAGMRRNTARQACCDAPAATRVADEQRVTATR